MVALSVLPFLLFFSERGLDKLHCFSEPDMETWFDLLKTSD